MISIYTPPASLLDVEAPTKRRVRLVELALIVIILWFLAAIFYPLLYSGNHRSIHATCSTHEKQIGIAMMQYAQDNDDRFPPAANAIQREDGTTILQQWALDTQAATAQGSVTVPGCLDNYLKDRRILVCPTIQKPSSGLTYLYNDLAATERLAAAPYPGMSVLVMDGDDSAQNFGHTRTAPGQPGIPGSLLVSPRTGAQRLIGGAVSNAATTRHAGGANYLFADSHVKYMLPDDIFFPPRFEARPTDGAAPAIGPSPGGGVLIQGKAYRASFYLR